MIVAIADGPENLVGTAVPLENAVIGHHYWYRWQEWSNREPFGPRYSKQHSAEYVLCESYQGPVLKFVCRESHG